LLQRHGPEFLLFHGLEFLHIRPLVQPDHDADIFQSRLSSCSNFAGICLSDWDRQSRPEPADGDADFRGAPECGHHLEDLRKSREYHLRVESDRAMPARLHVHTKLSMGTYDSDKLSQQPGPDLTILHRRGEWNVAAGCVDRTGVTGGTGRAWLGFGSIPDQYPARRAVRGISDQCADDERFMERLGFHPDLR